MTDDARRRNDQYARTLGPAALRNRIDYPGVPYDSPGVRLPEMPEGLAYESQAPIIVPPQPPPGLGVASDYETATRVVDFLSLYRRETPIYQTSGHWSDCDVVMTLPDSWFSVMTNPANGCILSFLVYAISGASRALVASGRFDNFTEERQFTKWVVAARGGGAERFAVTAQLHYQNATAFPTPPATLTTLAATRAQLTVVVTASNDLTEPPDDVGAITRCSVASANAGGLLVNGPIFNGISWDAPPALQVLGVAAVNTAAGARYLHVGETFAGAPSTVRSEYVFPLGAAIGSGFADFALSRRCRYASLGLAGGLPLYWAPALFISTSADPDVNAFTTDGTVSIKVR